MGRREGRVLFRVILHYIVWHWKILHCIGVWVVFRVILHNIARYCKHCIGGRVVFRVILQSIARYCKHCIIIAWYWKVLHCIGIQSGSLIQTSDTWCLPQHTPHVLNLITNTNSYENTNTNKMRDANMNPKLLSYFHLPIWL